MSRISLNMLTDQHLIIYGHKSTIENQVDLVVGKIVVEVVRVVGVVGVVEVVEVSGLLVLSGLLGLSRFSGLSRL